MSKICWKNRCKLFVRIDDNKNKKYEKRGEMSICLPHRITSLFKEKQNYFVSCIRKTNFAAQ